MATCEYSQRSDPDSLSQMVCYIMAICIQHWTIIRYRVFKRYSLCLDNGKSKLTDVPYAGNMCFAGYQDLDACMTQCGDN